MDLATALAPYGASRRQLRRFAAALAIDCDESSGSLAALVALYQSNPERVRREIRECLTAGDGGGRAGKKGSGSSSRGKKKNSNESNTTDGSGGPSDAAEIFETALATWAEEGLPAPAPAAEHDAPDTTHSVLATVGFSGQGDSADSSDRARCCVECRQPTPFVFEIAGAAGARGGSGATGEFPRLCQRCERQNPQKYQLLTVELAASLYAVSQAELRSQCASCCRLSVPGSSGGSLRAGPEVVLQAEAERLFSGGSCANRADSSLVSRKQATSAEEWRSNSFRTDHKGKTHKWKEWNSGTFQRKKQITKYTGGSKEDDMFAAMFDLSGLNHVGLG